MNIKQAIDLYMLRTTGEYTKSSRRGKGYNSQFLVETFGADTEINTITYDNALEFRQKLMEHPDWKISTRDQKLLFAKAIFRLMEELGKIEKDPFKKVKHLK